MAAAGLPVPNGFHVSTAAYRQFVDANNLQPRILAAVEGADPDRPATLDAAEREIQEMFCTAPIPAEIAGAIVQAYASLEGRHPTVAVRSSATAEDLPGLSFAGQQETYLNVSGSTEVLAAVRRCWASLWTARAIAYRKRHSIDQTTVSLAVVVQLLVPADAAGILFTADPVTGARDQALVSAAWGLGEAIVGGLVTPDTLTVDKAAGRVLSPETADKQVMTGRVNGGTQELPVPEELRHAPVLSDEQTADLNRLGVEIEALYGMPMDIEWALADGAFSIVQARPITGLSEPEMPPPANWPMPDPKGHYMRTSIIDLMPDPLTPLFATMGLSSISKMMRRLVKHLFRAPADSLPADVLTTINGYAYYNAGFTPRQLLIMAVKMVPAFPRMLREGVPYWRDVAHPRYREAVDRWQAQSVPQLSAAELLAGAREVVDAVSEHLGSLMASTMGPSAGAEGLFTTVYEKLIRRPGDPDARVFLLGIDNVAIQGEKALYDLAQWVRDRTALGDAIVQADPDELWARVEEDRTPSDIGADDWREWRRRFLDHLARYGYAIYTLDFGQRLPQDDPIPWIELLKRLVSGEGKSPYERQARFAAEREAAVAVIRARLKGIRRWAFEKSLKWAQSQVPLREDGIHEIGLGYPVLRRILRELGSRFVLAGAIERADDVFWLEEPEVEAAVTALETNAAPSDYQDRVTHRRAVWRSARRATPPPQIPYKERYLGLSTEAFTAAQADGQSADVLQGIGASPGRIRATARVLHGPEDFDRMQPGDILVAAITTPAWTPLFAMAAGVVTDIGGPLSHGSIVAREYGIPAVMGAGVATKRIRDGQTIVVDGSTGAITLNA